jgi:hypothetical protein
MVKRAQDILDVKVKAASSRHGVSESQPLGTFWTIDSWLGSDVNREITKGLMSLVRSADPLMERCVVRALGETLQSNKGPTKDSLILSILDQAQILPRIADVIQKKVEDFIEEVEEQEMKHSKSISGSMMNSKFSTAGHNFKLAFGHISTFDRGLQALVGLPEQKVYDAMAKEHCQSVDSDFEWTTGNYGITSTPKIE